MSACKYSGCDYNGALTQILYPYCCLACADMDIGYQRGREEERADVVAWLEKQLSDARAWKCIGDIERGEHEVKR